jgi:type III secretion protein C
MDDSLEYGVTWGTRFAGGNWAGGQEFRTDLSPLGNSLNQTGFGEGLGPTVADGLTNRNGLSMGVIGQRIVNTALGLEFNSIGALLHALRTKANANVILSPKIITEDNVPAEIFVGENISFKTQSIANDNSNTITNNYEYRDVGTRLRVTPSIGNNDVISLEIAQEISRIIPSTIPTGANAANQPGPSTTKSTTTTRVHLPDGYFLIISGMMNDEANRLSVQVPCLGAIPILGAAFKDKIYNDKKRNQMIFLRPQIVDTEEEIQNITKHQQDVWDFKKRRKKDWIYETEEAFDWLNLKRDIIEADPDLADRDV